MMATRKSIAAVFSLSVLLVSIPAYALDWPEIFEPLGLHSIYIETSDEDWETVRFDESTSIEVDALLGLNDEEKILVRMRRKGGDGYPSEADPQKVSLRIDINDLVDGQKFHGLTKVNLENGSGNGLVEEGLAWYLHQLATGPDHTSTFAGLAAFVRVYVNGDYKGIYLNSEFRNKQFFRNRAICCDDIATWLYKYDVIDEPELKTQDTDSAAYNTLCYAPFRGSNAIKGKNKKGGEGADCPTPSDNDLVAELESLINMNSLLTVMAVNSHLSDVDSFADKGKNFYFADFEPKDGYQGEVPKRLYYAWDLDNGFAGGAVGSSIYGQESSRGKKSNLLQTQYQEVILNHPLYRARYNDIYSSLLNGPMSLAPVYAYLDGLASLLPGPLSSEPYMPAIQDLAGRIEGLKTWLADREASVRAQIAANGPPAPRN